MNARLVLFVVAALLVLGASSATGGLALAASIVGFAVFARSGQASHRSGDREFVPGQPFGASEWP